jgi:hypothetical protein
MKLGKSGRGFPAIPRTQVWSLGDVVSGTDEETTIGRITAEAPIDIQ